MIAALDSQKIPYRVIPCDIRKLKQVLKPPHTVPQMSWRGELLTDSADIMKKIDAESSSSWKMYPTSQRAAIEKTEKWAGSTFNAYVLYFTWWVEYGFNVSLMPKLCEVMFPRFIPASLAAWLVPYFVDVGRLRGSVRKRVRGLLGEELVPPGRDPGPEEEPGMRRALIAAVTTLEEKLARSTDQLWLEQTAEPSAADFSVYGLIERLVGDEGDAQMGTATPWLWEESGASRLRGWHARMAGRFPLHFLGKESECKVWVQ